eukprot:352444-Chlamydomonas_euryale.AAC.4
MPGRAQSTCACAMPCTGRLRMQGCSGEAHGTPARLGCAAKEHGKDVLQRSTARHGGTGSRLGRGLGFGSRRAECKRKRRDEVNGACRRMPTILRSNTSRAQACSNTSRAQAAR